MKTLRAWVLKRKFLDEFGPSNEPPGTLMYFFGEPPEYGPAYEWFRMKHLDQKEELHGCESSVGATDHPGRY